MTQTQTQFLTDSETKAFDLDHRATIAFNIGRYDEAVVKGKLQYANLALARRRAAIRKHRVIENLEDHLKDFEYHFIRNGGKVLWAQDVDEARRAVLEILEKNYVKLVVKSKSMVTEEIDLTGFLEKNGIETLETDLGEYIVQLCNEKPYHIVTPVMHKSARDVARIFHEKFGLPEDSTPAEITDFVRTTLREKFQKAQAGITGANFLISSTGAVALTENEGNGVLSMSMPPIHIVVTGIEKILPTIDDLDLFWPLLATHGTGQQLSVYNTLVSGPRKRDEADGPAQMYVVLIDNGRSELLSRIPQRRALACIRCGACLNACPVYRNIGGHTYGTVYSGPIGAVITPHMRGLDDYKHLSYASSLCGKCTEVCPVNIDLHHQLLQNRNLSVRQGLVSKWEKWGMKGYKRFMSKRQWLDMPGAGVKNFGMRLFFGKLWGPRRELPRVAPKSFGERWKENQ
ncbi:MAG: lactate utilization protein [Bacteroidales bacterium]|nr:lactate utilization protein [Bacteroidales bacterium]